MSYSFSVVASSKDEAKQKAAEEFAKIVETQPVHAADRDAVLAVTSAYVDVLADPADGQKVTLYCCGSLSWREEGHFTTAGINATATLSPA